jgi:hypothetical protein
MKTISYGIIALFLLGITTSYTSIENETVTTTKTEVKSNKTTEQPNSIFIMEEEDYIDDIPFNTDEVVKNNTDTKKD